MTDTGDARYQTCKVCGAKDCDCTMGDWVTKLQAENAALKEQVAEQAREIRELRMSRKLRGDEIELLRQQLAAAQAEIGQIKLSWKQRDNEVGVLFNESLHQQLAAAQATNKALRESLQTFADVHGYVGKSDVTDAINLSNDDTALRAELAKVYEECAAECDNRAEKERAKAKIRRDCKEIAHAQMYDQNAEAAMLMARYLRDLAKRKLEQ